jgi:hypothetical protein
MRLFHFMSSQHALSSIRLQRVKLALIRELNDPFELLCADLPDPDARRSFNAFKMSVANRTGILCFSRDWANPLLWSHYAEKHRGVAIEFEVDEDALMRVRYVQRRIPFDLAELGRSGGFTQEHAESIFATKSKHWAYEKEMRVAVALTECKLEAGNYFYSLNPKLRMIGLIVGPICGLSEHEVAAELPIELELRFVRARQAFRSFSVVRNRSFSPQMVRGLRR